MAKRILVPLDRDDEAIVPLIADLARGSGATVRLLRVLPVPEMQMARFGRVIAYVDQEMTRLEGVALSGLLDAKAHLDGVPVETAVRFGDRATEIVLEADAFGADLIAVSAARPHLAEVLAADRANRLARRARVPVITLREPGRRAAA